MVNRSRLVASPLHSLLPSVQLSAQRSGETVARLVSLGRGLLGGVHVVWLIWRIPLVSGSHVLPQVLTRGSGSDNIKTRCCCRSVEPEYSPTGGMMGAAAIVTGVLAGIALSCLMPIIVSEPSLDWEHPTLWPMYDPAH